MRVGFFFENLSPYVGGGHTFEKEIFRALMDYSDKSRNSLSIISRNEIPSEYISSNLDYIILQQKNNGSKLSEKFGLSGIKKYLIDKYNNIKKTTKSKTESEIIQILIDNGIEIIFYLRPSNCLTMEIPYLTVVWDVQHLNQPYFPEVSHHGEWEKRENVYLRVLQRSARIITSTKVGKREIENFYQIPSDRVKVIPFPTPSFALDKVLRQDKELFKKFGIPKDYLLYPAQFWPHKNHYGLLHAVRILRHKYRIILPVVFVGSDRGNQKYIKDLVQRLQLTNQVHFLGYIPQDDLIAIYQNALALAYLTYFGPDNLPPLEAFALNCPVIASNIPGAKEQLGDAALIVDPGNYDQIAYAIKSIHEDLKLREELIKRGRERALQWKGDDYIRELFTILDNFIPIRRCWSSKGPYQPIKIRK
jgi:glycosyltransferase involved in cell wall biosynthesis